MSGPVSQCHPDQPVASASTHRDYKIHTAIPSLVRAPFANTPDILPPPGPTPGSVARIPSLSYHPGLSVSISSMSGEAVWQKHGHTFAFFGCEQESCGYLHQTHFLCPLSSRHTRWLLLWWKWEEGTEPEHQMSGSLPQAAWETAEEEHRFRGLIGCSNKLF